MTDCIMVDGLVIPRPDSKYQTRLDNSLEISNAKALRMLEYRRRTEERQKNRSLSWKYDEAEFRIQLKNSSVSVDETTLYDDYLSWLDDASIITLRDMTTGERVRKLSSKRGNVAYARKYRERLNDLDEMLSGLILDSPLAKGRDHYHRCQSLLVTLTYDHKKIDKQEAWHNVSKDITKFKIQAKRSLGAGSIASIAVKEGTKSGYPAPHLFILIDKPFIAIRHISATSKTASYRVHSLQILDGLKSSWRRGFIDVQAVVGGQVKNGKRKKSVASYLFKYLSKAVEPNDCPTRDDDDSERDYTLGVKTFAWQKLYRLRPLHIAKSFLTFVASRLDTLLSQSQHSTTGVWKFDSTTKCKLSDYLRVLTSAMPPDPRPWPIIGAPRGIAEQPITNVQ